MSIHDYITAVNYLQRGKFKREWWRNSRPIANNTRLEMRGNTYGDDIAVRLHGTDVVTYHADGTITLNTGGYWTVTTRDRINRFVPGNIPRVFRYHNQLCLTIVERYTPEKTIKCPECHGAYQSDEKKAFAVLSGWTPRLGYAWEGYRKPMCRCNLTGYVIVGGNPVYREWDGGPITLRAQGEIVE